MCAWAQRGIRVARQPARSPKRGPNPGAATQEQPPLSGADPARLPLGSRLASLRPSARRRYRGWLVATALLVLCGSIGAVDGARARAAGDAEKSRLAFASSAAEIASSVKLGLRHEQDLTFAADAFVVGQPNATQAQFLAWGRALQVSRRYPELVGLAFVVVVPHAQLASFAAHAVADPAAPLTDGRFVVEPAGDRANYCFSELELHLTGGVIPPAGYDYCNKSPQASTDFASSVSAQQLLPGLVVLAINTPVYRGGATPATASGRRSAFLGWTGMGVLPAVLLKMALRGHPKTAVALYRTAGKADFVFRSGTSPNHARSVTINLQDGSSLETFGVAIGSGIFADRTAIGWLVGGIAVSMLFGMLLFVLATGRERARRQVLERTRQLSEEVRLHALARDEAVESSNAKSVFVATVSHELRTPLAGVIGMTELLLETELAPDQRKYGELVRSSSEGLLLVINDILDYSKIEAGKLELEIIAFAPSELIAESCATLLPVAREKGVLLQVTASPTLPALLRGDPGRLRQVMINLLSNAVKFTSEGHVSVNVISTPTPDGVLVRVEVADSGIGIDAATLTQLFQPFTQADNTTARKYGGTGLGLTISSQLVTMMGGTIGVKSTPGEGSTFWFEVPLAISSQTDHASTVPFVFSAQGERDQAGRLTGAAPLVLIAEDNPVNQMLAARLLDKCGFRSEVVNDGYEALDAVAQNSYAAVLMDCQMPELDGYDTTREIRRREHANTHLPIVATTAHSMTGDREKCLDAGMDDYVTKPIRARELSDALSRSIAAAADFVEHTEH
jgi:signal transduction histidine kinase/ActR/RegA family two-component response regulator